MPAFAWLLHSLTALNPLAVLAGALICGALGAALVGDALFRRLHAVRVQGELTGVRKLGNVFRSVYRYSPPGGGSVEATANEGSSSLQGRETGSRRELLVVAAHPEEVEEAPGRGWTLIGVLFLAGAVWLFYTAVTVWPASPWTWIAAAVLLLCAGARLWRSILPAEKRLGAASFKALMRRRRSDEFAASPVLRSEDVRATPQGRAIEERQRALQRRFIPVLLLLGIALMGISIYAGRTLVRLESGVRVAGKVIALELRKSGSHGTYYPIVSFSTDQNVIVHFSDRVGSNPPAYHVGDVVTVLHPSGDLRAAIIDRGWVNWLPAVIMFIFGMALFAAGLRAQRMRAK